MINIFGMRGAYPMGFQPKRKDKAVDRAAMHTCVLMRARKLLSIPVWFVAALICLVTAQGHAGSVVIRDLRVQNLDVTPFLGRGYSVATNSYASSCLKSVTLTPPSYNFVYDFTSIDLNTSSLYESSGEFEVTVLG